MKLRNVFKAIKSRCNNKNNPAYKNYGGRGIRCEWKIFGEFYKDMGETYKEGLQIDREDNNGNYNQTNCRWITAKENSQNRRNNIIYKGVCLKEYCELNGLNYKSIHTRIQKGISIEDAISKPIFTPFIYNGYKISELSKIYNIKIGTIKWRLKHGKTIEQALNIL